MLKALAAPLVSKPTNGWHPSFTAWTTRVSNPVCSPRFRVSASVPSQSAAFATGVLPDICAFHRYTGNSTLLFRTLADGFNRRLGVEPRVFTADLSGRLHALYAQ